MGETSEAGVWRVFAIIATIALFLWVMSSDAVTGVKIVVVIMMASVGFGFWCGGYIMSFQEKWLDKSCDISVDNYSKIMTKTCRGSLRVKEERFILQSVVAVLFYIAFFFFCIRSFGIENPQPQIPEKTSPLPPQIIVVGVMTGAVLALIGYHVARYAAFVQRLCILASVLEKWTALDTDLVDPKLLLKRWRIAVFEQDQLYEPPGNIFVTLGIMSTFLGLALGLANTTFFRIINGDMAELEKSLKIMVACMSIGLGVSMIGVVIAMLSQTLRGCGPCELTEEILKDSAQKLLEEEN